MADELVSINNLKENVIEFELTVEGLSSNDFDTKFVIHSSDMELAFPCKKQDGGKWTVTLPPLPMLERTAYPFHLQVIAEGFHFRPLKGSVNIVGSPDIYVAGTKNIKLESPTKPVEPTKQKNESATPQKSQPTKSREKPIAQIAEELMEANKATFKKPSEAQPEVKKEVIKETLLPKIEVETKKTIVDTSVKDKAARKVLEDLGISVPKAKPKKRFTLKN